MRTLKVCVNCIPKKIPIGHVGENVVEAIQFDYSAWQKDYGNGILSLVLQRSPDVIPYAVDITDADGLYIVTSTDLEYQGAVRAQLVYNVTGNPVPVKKSDVFLLGVDVSLGDAGEIPDPWQSWLDRVLQASDAAQEAVEHYPKVENGYWYVWNVSTESWTNTGQKAQGEQGIQGEKGDHGVGIASTVLNADYTLTITLTDGTSYTTPPIRGEKGDRGERGQTGATGATGNGIASTVLNPNYTLTITFTDGTSYTTPSIRGEQGEQGIQGVPGQDYVITSADYQNIADLVDTMIADERQSALDDIDTAKDGAIDDIDAEGVRVIGTIPSDYTELSDDVSELKEDLLHKEDWIVGNAEQLLSDKYIEDSEPYVFRKSVAGDREFDEIVGGTIVWNQLIKQLSSADWKEESGVTVSFADGVATVSSVRANYGILTKDNVMATAGHKYLFGISVKTENTVTIKFGFNSSTGALIGLPVTGDNSWHRMTQIKNSTQTLNGAVYAYFATAYENVNVKDAVIIDLTQMFGSTIADYIYSLETGTAGAGIAKLKSWGFFLGDYYPYEAGKLESVQVSEHKMTGFNQWDEQWENGMYDSGTGAKTVKDNAVRNKTPIRVIPSTSYYFKIADNSRDRNVAVYEYDADMIFIQRKISNVNGSNNPLTLTANTHYINFYWETSLTTGVYDGTFCVNISWDGSRDGEYEAYEAHTYALDSDLVLRGIPKLSNNKMYFDGDTYESDGTVTRKYGIVDLGTLTWQTTNPQEGRYWVILGDLPSDMYYTNSQSYTPQLLLTGYAVGKESDHTDKTIWFGTTNYFGLQNSDYINKAPAEVKQLLSGSYMVYLKRTPTTETAEPFQSPQICSEYGTEEYVYDPEAFPVPVGHITKYPDNLRKKIDGLPWDLSMIAPVETGTKASQAYAVGKYFLLDNKFCKAKTSIASGATFTLNTNYEVTTIADELYTALH